MRACSLRWIAVFSFATVLCGCNSSSNVKESKIQPQDQGGTAGGVPPAHQPAEHQLPPALRFPNVQILSVGFQKEGNSGTFLLAPLVENSGPGAAEIDGNCQWKCPVPGMQVSGGLGLASTAFVNAGQRQTLEGNGAVICDNNPAPVQLSCSFSVRAVDSSGHPSGEPKVVSWNGQASTSR